MDYGWEGSSFRRSIYGGFGPLLNNRLPVSWDLAGIVARHQAGLVLCGDCGETGEGERQLSQGEW